MTFPDAVTLDEFRQHTLPPLAPSSRPLSYAELQAVGCIPEEDITVAYHRSFVDKNVVLGCHFLYGEENICQSNSALSSTLETEVSRILDTDDDWEDFTSGLSSDISNDDSCVFYDAVEPPECG